MNDCRPVFLLDAARRFFSGRIFGLTMAMGLVCGSSHAEIPPLDLKLVAEGLTSPVALRFLPDGRMLVADQPGFLRIGDAEGKLAAEPFLDLRARMVELRQGFDERGLLGLALHPGFALNGKFYVYYSAPRRNGAPEGWDHTSHISEFQIQKGNPAKADPSSERIILQVDQPQWNHDSGALAFGPDGYLYISLGDGGGGSDVGRGHPPLGNGQDKTTLLGSILRIDVNTADAYGIPKDNPFVGKEGRDEIFAYGLRNPWGMSFDRGGSRELFAGDVGQNLFEEVNIIVKGGNYGWHLREGFHCFSPSSANRPPEECPKVGADGEPLIDPILEYKSTARFPRDSEAIGVSVVGGHVYRGKAIPAIEGRYVFADWSAHMARPSGTLLAAGRPADSNVRTWSFQRLPVAGHPDGTLPRYITGIGEDNEGELYVLTNDTNGVLGQTGKIFKLVPGSSQR